MLDRYQAFTCTSVDKDLSVCTQVEGSLGYAHWVCSTLREKGRLDAQLYQYCIERMAAVPAAADALARFTGKCTSFG